MLVRSLPPSDLATVGARQSDLGLQRAGGRVGQSHRPRLGEFATPRHRSRGCGNGCWTAARQWAAGVGDAAWVGPSIRRGKASHVRGGE